MDKVHSLMRKKKIKGILIVLTVIMMVGSFQISSFASEIDQAKQEKSRLEKKKEETELRISELEKDKNDILKYIEKLDKELNKLTGEIDGLNVDIKKADKDLKASQRDLTAARAKEDDQYSIMKKRIKYMYENGNTDYLEVVMQSENLADVLNQVEYMSKITEYDNGLLDKYIKLKNDVIKKEKIQKEKIKNLKELKEEINFEKKTVEKLASDKNAEVKKYEASIEESQNLSASYSSKLEEQEQVIEDLLIAEAKRIEAERKAEEERKRKEEEQRRKEQESAAAANNNSSADNNSSTDNTDTAQSNFSGNFSWPVPSSGTISSRFGYRDQPTAGASTNHKGIDISAPSGSQIVAAADGTVVTATYSVSAGNYIMLSHGSGTYTVYMHCSKLLVSVGDQVSRGQEIALVGSTGISTGSHLHFGILINGSYVDPQNYVSN
jgi:murein DD-endopeptidase MepM/ murein hydrolase activator NlpD